MSFFEHRRAFERQVNGSNPPLFLVHPVGGGVMAYHDLAKYLGNEQPVYALQNHDRSDREKRTRVLSEKVPA